MSLKTSLSPHSPLTKLENVILAPHSVGYTEELYTRCGQSACASILAVARGDATPQHTVNPSARHKNRRVQASRGHAFESDAAKDSSLQS
jgi:phosphoglycerate dehydrogenase-like enzyme